MGGGIGLRSATLAFGLVAGATYAFSECGSSTAPSTKTPLRVSLLGSEVTLPEPPTAKRAVGLVQVLGPIGPSDPSRGAYALAIAGALRARLRSYLHEPITIDAGAIKVARTRESLGVRIDEYRLAAIARQLDERSPTLMTQASSLSGVVPVPAPVMVDASAALRALADIKDDADEAPEDARIDLDARRVLGERPGKRFDAFEMLDSLAQAVRSGAASVAAKSAPVTAQTTAADLAQVDLSTTLGWFETKYATDHAHDDRTFNLRLAASRLNGHVIRPGETFDFNAVVGPRDVAHGYRIAKVIADGELVDGIGGGTCQVAGTLHGAALFAGLEIVQRTPHTRPSSYIKMGLDAAVAYPHVNLKIRNPFDYPVVLKETVSFGQVQAEILGPARPRTVTFVRRLEGVMPFSVREVRDDRLPLDVRVTTQRGIPGLRVRRYRILRDGALAIREKSIDVYPPTIQVVHVGTGEGGDGPPPQADEHPEYLADEYLSITQSPRPTSSAPRDGEGPRLVEEVRVPGSTGEHGWTRRWTNGRPSDDDHDDGSGQDGNASREARRLNHPARRKK